MEQMELTQEAEVEFKAEDEEAPPAVEGNDESEETAPTVSEQLDVIVPNKEHVRWHFADKVYTQKPLSFFGKMEFFSLVGTALDLALQDGVTMNQLLAGATAVRGYSGGISDLGDADSLMRIVARLMQYSPNLLSDAYVIFLNVPRGEREQVKAIMTQPEEEGGLSDEQALHIMTTFVDQNIEAIRSFFGEEMPKLVKRGRTLMKQSSDAQSRQSKRSKRTQQNTQRQ